MKKTITILLATVLLFSLFVSCSNDGSVDEAFNCTITFNGNGSTAGEMSVQTVGIGIPTELNANTFGKTDFDFMWWTTEADGSGTVYRNGQHVCLEADLKLYAQWGHFLSEESTAWTDGQVYSFDRNLTVNERITVSGNVTLILPDGYTLTATKGITVNEGNSLTVNVIGEGTGTLISSGNIADYNAGIGGEYLKSAGTITINGGNVTATGGYGGAGIGGGSSGGGGSITINGGTVMATGFYSGAGIGGGTFGSGGTITINGGTVTAISNMKSGTAAGIGGGGNNGSGGTITINGGTVVAEGGPFISEGQGTAGIGGGYLNYNTGTITLGEGVVLEVSTDNANWSDYDGTIRQRYMRTK